MPRALVAEWSEVPPEQFEAARATWRRRHERISATGCHYWVFASGAEPGRYLEFIEARDAGLLREARRQAGLGGQESPILTEVELT